MWTHPYVAAAHFENIFNIRDSDRIASGCSHNSRAWAHLLGALHHIELSRWKNMFLYIPFVANSMWHKYVRCFSGWRIFCTQRRLAFRQLTFTYLEKSRAPKGFHNKCILVRAAQYIRTYIFAYFVTSIRYGFPDRECALTVLQTQ